MTMPDPTPDPAVLSDARALKPCPFCGADAERFTIGEDEPNNAGGDVIVCTRCQASSHVEFGYKENLVDSWNRRATPPASDAAVPAGREPMIAMAASLAAAISLLEKGGKKAAPSDKMFEQMLIDYRRALEDGRTALAGACAIPPAGWHCTRKVGHDGPCAAIPDGSLEDEIADAIDDSLDMDWTGAIGSRAVMALLRSKGLVA